MSWRIVVVHNTAKLDLQLQYLVVRSEMKTQKIHISEIEYNTLTNAGLTVATALINKEFLRYWFEISAACTPLCVRS